MRGEQLVLNGGAPATKHVRKPHTSSSLNHQTVSSSLTKPSGHYLAMAAPSASSSSSTAAAYEEWPELADAEVEAQLLSEWLAREAAAEPLFAPAAVDDGPVSSSSASPSSSSLPGNRRAHAPVPPAPAFGRVRLRLSGVVVPPATAPVGRWLRRRR